MLRLLIVCLLLCSPAVLAEVKLLTSIKPLQLIAAAVQDGLGQPEVLLPAGASPHNFALRPSDVRRVHEAQLLYWVGPDMETFLPRILVGRTLPSVAVQDLQGMQLRFFGEHQSLHDAHDEHDHAHRPGTLDAHLWLLPANAKVIATKMGSDLAALDPVNANAYEANVRAFAERLDALDRRLKDQLSSLQSTPFFVFHEAYDYFEAAYGVRHAGVFSLTSEVQPGAQRVAQMRQQLVAAGPVCVFSEPPLRPRLAETLSADLPVKLAELDALGSRVAVSATGYEQLLQDLADGLSTCLRSVH